MAEVVRRGIEYMALAYPVRPSAKPWVLPVLKSGDFRPDIDQLDSRHLQKMTNSGGIRHDKHRHQCVALFSQSRFHLASACRAILRQNLGATTVRVAITDYVLVELHVLLRSPAVMDKVCNPLIS